MSGSLINDLLFRYSMSNAQMHILVSRSLAVTHFRLLYCKFWKGRNLLVKGSKATISVSIMKFSTSSLIAGIICSGSSGNYNVIFSKLREYNFISDPARLKWICPLIPSYLYSHVKLIPLNLSRTSPMPFIDFDSIGFIGIPTLGEIYCGKFWKSLLDMIILMISSWFGNMFNESLIRVSTFLHYSSS
jgi:hypothetical protein